MSLAPLFCLVLLVGLTPPASASAPACRIETVRTHRSLALSNCRGERIEMCESQEPRKRSCAFGFAVHDAQATPDGRWLFVYYSSRDEPGPRWLDVFDFASGKRTAHFHPWFGDGFCWAGEEILLIHGCGTSCSVAHVFTKDGVESLVVQGAWIALSPERDALVVSKEPHAWWSSGEPRQLQACLVRLSDRSAVTLRYEVPSGAEEADPIPSVRWSPEKVFLDLSWSRGEQSKVKRFSFPRSGAGEPCEPSPWSDAKGSH